MQFWHKNWRLRVRINLSTLSNGDFCTLLLNKDFYQREILKNISCRGWFIGMLLKKHKFDSVIFKTDMHIISILSKGQFSSSSLLLRVTSHSKCRLLCSFFKRCSASVTRSEWRGGELVACSALRINRKGRVLRDHKNCSFKRFAYSSLVDKSFQMIILIPFSLCRRRVHGDFSRAVSGRTLLIF